MNAELTKALKELFQNTLERHWEQASNGDYGALEMYEYALPPRRSDGLKLPSLVFIPVKSKDKEEEQTITVEIGVCVAMKMPAPKADREETEKQIAAYLVEGNIAVVNMMSVMQDTVANTTLLGRKFRYEGGQEWTLCDNNSQPSPYFYGFGRVEYKKRIIKKISDTEVKAYGSKV